MSEVKHTPLPWKMVSAPNFDNGLVYTSVQPVNVDEEAMKPLAMMNGEYHVCRMSHTAAEWRFGYHRANAAFIVKACNSYYDMQAELNELRMEKATRDAELARVVEERDRMRKALEACPIPSLMGNAGTHYRKFYGWFVDFVQPALEPRKGERT